MGRGLYHYQFYGVSAYKKQKKTVRLLTNGFFYCICQLVANVGQKSNLASTLDSGVELTLVNSASAGHSSGQDLAALADELAELSGILVIDISNLIGAENANLLSSANNGARRTRNVFSHLMNPPI
jgi:hypothetical protein